MYALRRSCGSDPTSGGESAELSNWSVEGAPSGASDHSRRARTRPMEDARESDLDAQLARLANGERSAFTLVFKRLQQPIFRLCMSMLHHEADARDATQQALEKILARASDYDPARPALPWACAIAAWECRTILRRRQRNPEHSRGANDEQATAGGEAEVLRRELIDAAVQALGKLSDIDRDTLVATFVGEAVDVSPAGFRKRRQRALQRLRTSFRRLYGLD